MIKKIAFLFIVFLSLNTSIAQELNCTVTINSDRVTNVNKQIFITLQNQVSDFLNNTKWTDKEYKQNEKIDCSFFLNISSFDSNDFAGTLQILSSRTIFNSNYATPVLNLNDNEIGFRYIEYENFIYDPNSYTSNLVSILSFYANLIIGVDNDTFQELGGTKQLQIASNIVNFAQSGGYAGWNQTGVKNNNRYFLVSDMISNTFEPYRKAMYQYHLGGLDLMSDDLKAAKEKVTLAIKTLSQLNNIRPNALLTRTFFDAKSDEIVSIFSGGPATSNSELIAILSKISPLNSAKWENIR
ncbi:DUF4835 family protein [Flavobacterium sp.]|uniref:type IX secretion system protein PorD n=1 Tax=Flavobacterium sp. TaxID=239 RepID=UPI003F69DC38